MLLSGSFTKGPLYSNAEPTLFSRIGLFLTMWNKYAWISGVSCCETCPKLCEQKNSNSALRCSLNLDTVKALTFPTKGDTCFSVAVSSNGEYGIDKGLMFSYPIRFDGTHWKVVEGVELNSFCKEKIQVTEKELKDEREAVKDLV